jgi:beta-phosphoglucomutase-like phosphatase (HAD superfamily)
VPGVQAARSAGMRALAYAGEPYANPAALEQAGGEVFEAMNKLPGLVLA